MAVPSPAPIDKHALRTQARAARDRFVAGLSLAKRAGAMQIPAAFLERLQPGLTVASYSPVGSEADPAPLVAAARNAGCVIALPHITTRAEPMRFLHWDAEAPLASGPFGLTQPRGDAAERVPDIILTPLVAFDAALNRLGQGAGYYDRAFAGFPDAWRLGIAWDAQQVEALPTDSWDVPLQALVTQSRFLIRTMS